MNHYIVSLGLLTCLFAVFICTDNNSNVYAQQQHINKLQQQQNRHLRLHRSSLNANINKNNKKQTLVQYIDNLQQQLPININKEHFRRLLDDKDSINIFNEPVNEKICMECGKTVKQSDRHRHLINDNTALDNTTTDTTAVTSNSVVRNSSLQTCIEEILKELGTFAAVVLVVLVTPFYLPIRFIIYDFPLCLAGQDPNPDLVDNCFQYPLIALAFISPVAIGVYLLIIFIQALTLINEVYFACGNLSNNTSLEFLRNLDSDILLNRKQQYKKSVTKHGGPFGRQLLYNNAHETIIFDHIQTEFQRMSKETIQLLLDDSDHGHFNNDTGEKCYH
jgi:hypothetical protein